MVDLSVPNKTVLKFKIFGTNTFLDISIRIFLEKKISIKVQSMIWVLFEKGLCFNTVNQKCENKFKCRSENVLGTNALSANIPVKIIRYFMT